ncbi:MAG: hypothetical protein AB1898_03525 [Acidobacteriota bacterium]
MFDFIAAALNLLALAASIAVPLIAFWRLRRRVRLGLLSKSRAIALFWLLAFLPPIAFVGGFFSLVGLEELTGMAIISEGLGRSFFLVVGFLIAMAVLWSLIFTVIMLASRLESA